MEGWQRGRELEWDEDREVWEDRDRMGDDWRPQAFRPSAPFHLGMDGGMGGGEGYDEERDRFGQFDRMPKRLESIHLGRGNVVTGVGRIVTIGRETDRCGVDDEEGEAPSTSPLRFAQQDPDSPTSPWGEESPSPPGGDNGASPWNMPWNRWSTPTSEGDDEIVPEHPYPTSWGGVVPPYHPTQNSRGSPSNQRRSDSHSFSKAAAIPPLPRRKASPSSTAAATFTSPDPLKLPPADLSSQTSSGPRSSNGFGSPTSNHGSPTFPGFNAPPPPSLSLSLAEPNGEFHGQDALVQSKLKPKGNISSPEQAPGAGMVKAEPPTLTWGSFDLVGPYKGGSYNHNWLEDTLNQESEGDKGGLCTPECTPPGSPTPSGSPRISFDPIAELWGMNSAAKRRRPRSPSRVCKGLSQAEASHLVNFALHNRSTSETSTMWASTESESRAIDFLISGAPILFMM